MYPFLPAATYEPLIDPTGQPIGMLFIGFPKAPYDAQIWTFVLMFAGVLAAVLTVILISTRSISNMFARPLESLSQAYETYFAHALASPILRIETDELDYVHRAEDLLTVVDRVRGKLREGTYQESLL